MGKPDQGSAAAEGARRAPGDAAGPGRGGRLSVGRKREVVLRLLRGEDLESVSRAVGITAARASQWRDRFLAAGAGQPEEPGAGCLERRRSSAAGQDRRAADGERVTVREGGPAGGGRPFGPAEVEAMRGAHSISTRRAYGLQRICRVWHCARSSVYARRQATTSQVPCRRRPGRRPGRPHSPGARSVALSWRRVPEGLGEAPGRGNPHFAGTGAPVDARARPPGPTPRGPGARPEGT